MPDSLLNNLGDENIVINNPVETQTFQHGKILENTFAIIHSNRQDEDQYFVEAKNVDKDWFINQIETKNNVTIAVYINLNFNDIESTLDLGNNVINSENDDSNVDASNTCMSNDDFPIAAPSTTLLPYNSDPIFPDIASEKEDDKVLAVNPSGSARKSLWPLPS